jgi:hypothetical protein
VIGDPAAGVDDERVRSYLSDPPRWVVAVLIGVPFGLAMGLWDKSDGSSWSGAAFMATSGIPFGLVTAWRWPQWRRQADQAAAGLAQAEAGLAADKLPAARLAATRGPVPADPEIRATALRIASHELAEATRHRTFKIFAIGLTVIGTVGAASEGSLSALWSATVAGGLLYLFGFRPRRLQRRIELLRAAEGRWSEPNHHD